MRLLSLQNCRVGILRSNFFMHFVFCGLFYMKHIYSTPYFLSKETEVMSSNALKPPKDKQIKDTPKCSRYCPSSSRAASLCLLLRLKSPQEASVILPLSKTLQPVISRKRHYGNSAMQVACSTLTLSELKKKKKIDVELLYFDSFQHIHYI